MVVYKGLFTSDKPSGSYAMYRHPNGKISKIVHGHGSGVTEEYYVR
jgi:hypothetical protein